jgi:hypothetical protein
MKYVDLNELQLASYNELVRLNFLEDKTKEELTEHEKQLISNKIYERLGDTYLSEVLTYDENDGKLKGISFNFTETNAFKELILLFALCYVNDMNFNEYFNLKIRDRMDEINKYKSNI